MSFEPIIDVRGLGKMYHLYERPVDRLRQAFYWGRRKLYREFWALRDVSFSVQRGEVVGVIGRNGCGKSTLLQILAGVLKPSSGEAAVRGRTAALLELGSGFNPEFTGRENIYMNASILGLSRRQIDERYDAIVDFAQIGPFIDQPVKTYSSGMYVRLAFAISVHVDAELLLVDEALSVGDAAFQAKCLHHLETLLSRGVTVLLVSHENQLVKSYCSRAIYLREGSIQYQGECETAVEQFLMEMRSQQLAQLTQVAAKPALAAGGIAFGSNKGRITAALCGADDGERNHFHSGQRVWVDVTAQVDQSVRRPRLSMVVRDLKGYNLFSYNNLTAGVELSPDAAGMIRGRFSFDCNLQAGDYSILLRLEDFRGEHDTELLDRQVNTLVFKVLVEERKFYGVVNLGGVFEVIGSAVKESA